MNFFLPGELFHNSSEHKYHLGNCILHICDIVTILPSDNLINLFLSSVSVKLVDPRSQARDHLHGNCLYPESHDFVSREI